MDLKRIKYFCKVAEHGSISEAARQLNMAQPPLSKRIQELEDEIGAPLLIRNNNGVEITAAGNFFTSARVIFLFS
ncbi:LysR family transcriptional regulator [Klebsiella aerogenes]